MSEEEKVKALQIFEIGEPEDDEISSDSEVGDESETGSDDEDEDEEEEEEDDDKDDEDDEDDEEEDEAEEEEEEEEEDEDDEELRAAEQRWAEEERKAAEARRAAKKQRKAAKRAIQAKERAEERERLAAQKAREAQERAEARRRRVVHKTMLAKRRAEAKRAAARARREAVELMLRPRDDCMGKGGHAVEDNARDEEGNGTQHRDIVQNAEQEQPQEPVSAQPVDGGLAKMPVTEVQEPHGNAPVHRNCDNLESTKRTPGETAVEDDDSDTESVLTMSITDDTGSYGLTRWASMPDSVLVFRSFVRRHSNPF